jgi:hypothetical protein
VIPSRSKIPQLNIVLVSSALAACWLIVIWAMGRGYEFTDDAYYLIWASSPRSYAWSVSEFGFLWHPIFELVDGDIRLFRIAGAILLSGSAGVFAWSIWRLIAPLLPRFSAPILIISISTASFWNYVNWIPTPGYNELNLIGLLLFMAGLILATPLTQTTKLIESGTLAAFGLTITAFAKPTTALSALVIGLLWLWLLRPKRPLMFVLYASGLAFVFLMLGIFIIDGSIHDYIQRKLVGLHFLHLTSVGHSGYSLFRSTVDPVIDLFASASQRSLTLQILSGGFLWSMLLLWTNDRYAALKTLLNLIAAAAFALTIGFWRSGGTLDPKYYIALISPLLLAISVSLSLLTKRRSNEDAIYQPMLALALLSVCAAFSFSIGTSNGALFHESQAAVFWLAALILLATVAPAKNRNDLVSGAALVSSFLTVGMLIGATADPYRLLAPIWQQIEPVKIGKVGSPLLVDRVTANYINTLQSAAASHGFEPGTPIIDLTGESPGTVYALGGTAPGRGWLNGGYPGSATFAQESLRLAEQSQIRRAWVLTGNSNGTIPDSVLQSLGLNFRKGYQPVGVACKGAPCVENILWKPSTQ